MDEKFWVYIMSSESGTLYIGMTRDIQVRVWEHKQGMIQGFTKRYGCDRLVYYEELSHSITTINREKQLKGWTRAKKIALIESVNPRWEDLAANWGRPILMASESIKCADERTQKQKHLVLESKSVGCADRKGRNTASR